MALENGNGNGNGMIMPVSPMGYGGGFNMGGLGGFGGFGGDWSWILLLLLISNGGWGGFGGWGGMMGAGMLGADMGLGLYPWMNQAELTQGGFNQQSTNTALNGIQSAVNGIGNQLCNGVNDITQAVNAGFANAETSNNARQIANMQQAFAAQTAVSQGMNALATQQQNCCCETREAIAAANAANIQEHCQDRYDAQSNTRDIIGAVTAGIQSIKDELCNDRYNAVIRENETLRTQLSMKDLAASQAAQTAQLIQDNNAQTAALIQRIAPYPVPTVPFQGFYGNGFGGCGGCGNCA